jgi:hypothetical protein
LPFAKFTLHINGRFSIFLRIWRWSPGVLGDPPRLSPGVYIL